MDAGLDNANNPFAISNGATTDNIISQKSEGLLLNLTDNFKKNGSELSPTTDYYEKEKSNGKRSASEFDDDDDFGPETDVDAVDDVLSPLETTKGFTDAIDNNNPFDEGVYNPFMEHQEKATLEMERNLQKQDSGEFEEPRMAREETPTPPADAVHDVRGLEENVADSDSEDEWNYIKGEEANKENISPVPEQKVADIPEEDDNMSQLNPNAAEFVPVSPTRSVPSPACRVLINDHVISQSPKRPVNELDINLPNPSDFEKEVKSRPSEVESYSNGHNGDSDSNTTPTDLMEGILNGKNIDEIPEFQPGSTPKKVLPSDEFHFGPNAAPFTPVRLLDQSEAALSTRAIYGDESFATVETSFNESDATEDVATDLNTLNKESDPMSMSFYADKGDSNPFDLDKVQVLPENLDEFLKQPDTENFDETISDLPEHHPLGEPQQSSEPILNNDDALQITDLDKHSYDDEKELASPLEPDSDVIEIEKDSSDKDSSEKDLLGGVEETDFSKTPEPRYENLLEEKFCHVSEKSESLGELPANVEVISPSPTPEIISPEPRTESPEKSIQSTNEDLSCERPHSLENIPHDVELISPETMERLSESPRPDVSEKEVTSPVEEQASEVSDLLKKPESTEVDEFLNRPEDTEVSDLLLQPEAEEVSDLLGRPEANESSDLLSQPKAEEVDDFLNQPEATEVDDLLNQPEATEISNLLEQSNSTVTNNVQNQLDDVLKQPVATEVSNLLGQPESLEKEDLNKQTEVDVKLEKLIHPEVSDLLNEPDINEVSNTLVQPVDEFLEQPRPNDVEEVMERTELHDMLEHPKVSECDELSKLAETAEVANLEVQETLTKVCELSLAKSPELLEVSEPAVIASESPVSKSPLPENENIESFTPVCQLPCMKEPEEVGENEVKESQLAVCEPPVSKSPAVELFESKSPICEITESKSSVCDLSESKSPFPDEVVGSVQSDSGDLESPASPDFTRPELIEQAQVHFVELCHPTEDIHHTESPQEDITSSVRDDDITSPVSPPVNDVIEDSFIAEQPTVCAVAQDITSFVLEAGSPSSTLNRELEVPSPKSIADTESVATTDVNSFLERSLPPEVNSPLSTTEDEIEKDLYSNNPLHKCVYPLPPQPTSEEIDIKTENISPEFAEQTVVTPSEESKQEEIPVISLLESSVVEPVVEEKPESKELAGEVTAVGVVAAVATGAAIAAVASATKVEENKKSTVASTKKLSVSKSSMATSKSTPKQSPVPKTTSRPSASPRVAPSKTGAPKSSVTAAPKAAPPKPQTKPKSSLPPKPAEKKPATSSDLKSAVKSATTVKKITSESVTKTASTNKSTTATSKVSPTKAAPSRPAAATSRPTAAPRPAPAPKAALTRPTTAVNTAAKARPTTLTNKPLASSSPSKTTSSVTKVTLSKTSMKRDAFVGKC
nr:titin-like [Leptinotarsa decemlineata]